MYSVRLNQIAVIPAKAGISVVQSAEYLIALGNGDARFRGHDDGSLRSPAPLQRCPE